MTLMSFLCSCFRHRAEPLKPEKPAATTGADLRQNMADDVLSESTLGQRGPLKPGDEAPPGTPGTGEDVCPKCNGSGQLEGKACQNCRGTGKVTRGIGGG